MSSRINRAKRLISYILFYALLCGVIEPGVTGTAFAAALPRGNRTAANYLQPGMVSTEAGIIVDGRKVRLETYGSRFFVVDKEMEDGFAIITTEAGMVTTGSATITTVTATGAGLVASGTAVDLTAGLSKEFEITGPETPALFSFRTAKLAGNCRQFRIITEAAGGFEVWLLDQSLQPIATSAGVGGSNILRYALKDYTSYYLLVCGDAAASGKLMYSDIIDDYGDDFSTAGDLAFNRDYIIETEIAGDVDVLTFCTSSTVSNYYMNIESVSGSGGTFEVFDQSWKKIAEYSGTMNNGGFYRTFTPEMGKRYYFRFTSEQTGRKILLHISQNVVRYRITYHLHGGKNDKNNPTSYVSTTSKFRLKKATRSKYLFEGWYTDAAYRNKVSSIKGANQRNFDLHAKWKKVSPAKTQITRVKSTKKKQAVVKWKKAKEVKGYQLVYGTTRGLNKKTKKKITKKISLTIRGLKAGKTYYFKVRCYSKDSKGKKVYGKYSKVKKVKIKDKKKKTTKKKTAKKTTATAKKKTTKKTTATAKKKTTKKTTATAKKKTTKKKTATAKKKTTKKTTATAKKKTTKKTTSTTKKKK